MASISHEEVLSRAEQCFAETNQWVSSAWGESLGVSKQHFWQVLKDAGWISKRGPNGGYAPKGSAPTLAVAKSPKPKPKAKPNAGAKGSKKGAKPTSVSEQLSILQQFMDDEWKALNQLLGWKHLAEFRDDLVSLKEKTNELHFRVVQKQNELDFQGRVGR